MLHGSSKKIESGQEVTVIRAEKVSELKKDMNPQIEKKHTKSFKDKDKLLPRYTAIKLNTKESGRIIKRSEKKDELLISNSR